MSTKQKPHFVFLAVLMIVATNALIFAVAPAKTESTYSSISHNRTTESLTNLPSEYVGSWRGNGVQVNPSSSWTMLLTLTAGEIGSTVGTIAYPSLRCGGELTLQNVNSNSIELFEDITYGTSDCVDEGTVTLNLVSANELGYAWEKEGCPTTATGELTKISSAGNETPPNYSGIWRGEGIQDNPPSQWTILLGLNNGVLGSIVGSIAYPSLRCGGELTLVSVNSNSIELFEDITYGTSDCVDEGTVTLNLESANELGYAWEKVGFPGTATGSLTRIGGIDDSRPTPFLHLPFDHEDTWEYYNTVLQDCDNRGRLSSWLDHMHPTWSAYNKRDGMVLYDGRKLTDGPHWSNGVPCYKPADQGDGDFHYCYDGHDGLDFVNIGDGSLRCDIDEIFVG